MPTVPETRSAEMVGTGQALIGMSIEAVEPQAAVIRAWMVPVAEGVPEMTFPRSERPAGRPVTERAAPGGTVRMEANGRPTVPASALADIVGTAHVSMMRSTDAVAPHAAVAVTWTVPAADGVPEMTFPASVRPAGRPVALMVVPGVAVIVERNGSPAMPVVNDALIKGLVHGLTTMVSGALVPQEFWATAVMLPLARGVPEMTLPTSARPVGRVDWRAMVAPADGVRVVVNGSPAIPERELAVRVGVVHDATVISAVAVEPQAVSTLIVPVPAAVGVPETTLPASVRPAGRLSALMVVPTGAVIVDRNATPTVPVATLAATVGAGHGSHDDSVSTCMAYFGPFDAYPTSATAGVSDVIRSEPESEPSFSSEMETREEAGV